MLILSGLKMTATKCQQPLFDPRLPLASPGGQEMWRQVRENSTSVDSSGGKLVAMFYPEGCFSAKKPNFFFFFNQSTLQITVLIFKESSV